MATAAGYDIVLDDRVGLDADGIDSEDFPLEFPANFNAGVRSVLSYMVAPHPDEGVEFTMTLPTRSPEVVLVERTFVPFMVSTLRQEVIAGNLFEPAGEPLRIRVTRGGAAFSDIVLMFQVDVR